MRYDALNAPDPEAWLDLDERERIDQVIEYHRRSHLPMGQSAKLHGVAHVVVENQIALGDPLAVRGFGGFVFAAGPHLTRSTDVMALAAE
jgi:hypothetical protein